MQNQFEKRHHLQDKMIMPSTSNASLGNISENNMEKIDTNNPETTVISIPNDCDTDFQQVEKVNVINSANDDQNNQDKTIRFKLPTGKTLVIRSNSKEEAANNEQVTDDSDNNEPMTKKRRKNSQKQITSNKSKKLREIDSSNSNSEPNQQQDQHSSSSQTLVNNEDISKILETMKELKQDMEIRKSLPNCASKDDLQNLKRENDAFRREIDQLKALNDKKDKYIHVINQIKTKEINENRQLKNVHEQELKNLTDKNEELKNSNEKFSLQLDILMKQMGLPEDQRNFSSLREKIDELKRAYVTEKQNAALEKDRADYLALNVPMNDSNVLELNPHLG